MVLGWESLLVRGDGSARAAFMRETVRRRRRMVTRTAQARDVNRVQLTSIRRRRLVNALGNTVTDRCRSHGTCESRKGEKPAQGGLLASQVHKAACEGSLQTMPEHYHSCFSRSIEATVHKITY